MTPFNYFTGLPKQLFYILLTILILIPHQSQTKEIILNQDKPFILHCINNNRSKNSSKLDLKILGQSNTLCLSGCEFQSSLHACTVLAKHTSNYYCETGKYCDKRNQCNFVFNNASIELDGYNLACTDDGVQTIDWHIKGNLYKII